MTRRKIKTSIQSTAEYMIQHDKKELSELMNEFPKDVDEDILDTVLELRGTPGDVGVRIGTGLFCRVISICPYSLHTLPINPTKFQPILTPLIKGMPGGCRGVGLFYRVISICPYCIHKPPQQPCQISTHSGDFDLWWDGK